MEHLVKFQTAERREGQHTAASLEEALRFVERLRNNEGATEVHVFRMHEVPIEFRTYFKVEVRPGEEVHTPADATPAEGAAPSSAGGSSSTAPDADGEINGRRLFSRT